MSRSPNIISRYAKRTVFANRGRSILTLIGIIVATMMFSIVASAYVSAIDILKSFANDDYGTWHVEGYSMTSIDFQKIRKDPRVSDVVYIQELGYNPGNVTVDELKYADSYKYFLGAMDPIFPEICELQLVRGRMPQDSTEAIISLEMYSDDREKLQLGKLFKMDTYARYSDGHKVMNLEHLLRDQTGALNEQLYLTGSHSYRIVGYFIVPEYAKWKGIAQNTILTISDNLMTGNAVNAYFQLSDPSTYQDFAEESFEDEDKCLYNKDYIRMEKSADDSRIRRAIGVVMGATIGMIVLLAVMLIYNSFSTSSAERMRAIGLLKSVGATRRQVRELMLSEAFYFSIIGIPIGVALGQLASVLLFRFLRGLSSNAANYFIAKNIDLHYRLGYQNTLGPAVLSIVTILVAILLPMMHVSKVAPIEAVHANEYFEEGKFRFLPTRLTGRLFGFAGALSMKNYFRYRKRYRATVISIVASILMILFANMLVRSVSSTFHVEEGGDENSISYVKYVDDKGFTQDDRAMFYELAKFSGVTRSSMTFSTDMYLEIQKSTITPEFRGMFMVDENNEILESAYLEVAFVFVEDSAWRELCNRYGIDPEPYLEYGSSACILNNRYKIYSDDGKTTTDLTVFSNLPASFPFPLRFDADGQPKNEALYSRMSLIPMEIADWGEELNLPQTVLQIYFPMSRLSYYEMEECRGYEIFQFSSDTPRKTYQEMKTYMQNNLYMTEGLEDTGVFSRARHAINDLVRIIMYGYVAMLSLMCFLNVVMTVISNIVFRRKEYILMMSVGMTRKTLFRMVIAESLIYFFESMLLLAFLLFVGILISMALFDPHIFRFIHPAYSIIVVFLHLFVVVSTTAIGLSQVMNDEIIEGIRKEYY